MYAHPTVYGVTDLVPYAGWSNATVDSKKATLRNCELRKLGSCDDMVARHICNHHARLFGIEFRAVSLHRASGKTEYEIVSYMYRGALMLPLFVSLTGIPDRARVRQFASARLQQESTYDLTTEQLATVIESLLAPQARAETTMPAGWVSMPNSVLQLVRDHNSPPCAYGYVDPATNKLITYRMPLLHQYLLEHCRPSQQISWRTTIPQTDKQHEQASIERCRLSPMNLTLLCVDNHVFLATPNPDGVLVVPSHEKDKDYIASPIVLAGSANVKSVATPQMSAVA